MLICSLIIGILLIFLLTNAKKRQRIEEEKSRVEKENLALKEKSIDELAKYFCNESKKQSEALENLKQWNRYYINENNNLRADIRNNQKTLDSLKQEGINSVQRDLARERENQTRIMNLQIEEDKKKKIREFQELNDKLQKVYEENKNEKDEILAELQKEIDDFRARRAVINKAIALENEQIEEQDKHRILLSSQDKEDIRYLLSIEDKINNKQLLRKLIWSEYLQKPFNDMLKRLFSGSPPKNVIYCIENIVSHKKYIGKTTAEVSKRWTEHIKTSLEIGTIKSQDIHKVLYGNWDNFTFSIITITEKEKISSEEKYYIKLFESDIYGYNMKSGG